MELFSLNDPKFRRKTIGNSDYKTKLGQTSQFKNWSIFFSVQKRPENDGFWNIEYSRCLKDRITKKKHLVTIFWI